MNLTLHTKTYPEEGEFQHIYAPFRNFIKDGKLSDFNVSIEKFPININNPISIECQPSYDGTVNLIISDDENPIRMINSRFTKVESGRFKIINRDQIEQTNIYKEDNISTTNLLLKPKTYPKLKFKNIISCGTLAGGNYTFYMKYVDGDGNESDFVAETFQIPVYKGSVFNPKTISGALVDEKTDKAVLLLCTELDSTFQKIKLYYTRETSDLNGYRISKAYEIVNTFEFKNSTAEILITGHEEMDEISINEINAERFSFTSAKTQCQLQNMLFLGNISKTTYDSYKLRNAALFFKVKCVQNEDVGWIDPADYSINSDSEYYNPENVCYKTGYWPGELYRMGVVYILEDGSFTNVYNLRGCKFSGINDEIGSSNLLNGESYVIDGVKQNIPANSFIDSNIAFSNSYGVFQNPNISNDKIIDYANKKVVPIHYEFSLEDEDVIAELKACGVKGWFFVRQKRLPFTLFQGISLDVDEYSGSPMIWDGKQYYTESFLTNNADSINKVGQIVRPSNGFFAGKTFSKTGATGGCALIAPDVNFIPDLQNTLCGSEMLLEKQSETTIPLLNGRNLRFVFKPRKNEFLTRLPSVFVNEDVPYKIVNDFQFSTRFGSPESTKNVSFFGKLLDADSAYHEDNKSLLRGVYTSFVGICGHIEKQCLYSVKTSDYSEAYVGTYIKERGLNHSPFYTISDKRMFSENKTEPMQVWGGDCYSNTVTIRLNRNFTDPDAPINDYVLDPDTWSENYKGYLKMKESTKDKVFSKDELNGSGDYYKINRGDLNSAPMGLWLTFKLLSSYNLGLRSEDRSHTEEMALVGNPRSFYPLRSMSISSNAKISESSLLNSGYSATVSAKEYYEIGDAPYIKNLFDNRVVYSNIQVEDEFKNGYRVFSEIAYQDIDRQYGAIVKLLPWGTNLLCVFEHGIGILPVNQQALLQTQGGTLSLGGAGVLQSNVQLISGDFGSIWPESVIKTNIGVYGIDTYAKKIWRYSDAKGFELLSDMKVQRFLNDNIRLSEKDKTSIVALRNVKTHFNAHKGDVMFTFYNHLEESAWNLCYNERLGKWQTRYSWIPLCSENINNVYYSLDKKRAALLGYVADINNNSPVTVKNFIWNDMAKHSNFETDIVLDSKYDSVSINLAGGLTSFFNEKDEELFINISKDELDLFCKWYTIDEKSGVLKIENDKFDKWFNLYSPVPIPVGGKQAGLAYEVNREDITIDDFNRDEWERTLGEITEEEKENLFEALTDEEKIDFAYKYKLNASKIKYLDKIAEYKANHDKDPSYVPTDPEDRELFEKYLEENMPSKEDAMFNPRLPLYIKIDLDISTTTRGYTPPTPLRKSIVILSGDQGRDDYDKMLVNGFYVHGRAGIFDEMNYQDDDPENQIQPTKWYDKQEPFEFEFVINSPVGIHKIFDNLVIISNNVQPNSIEYTIEGDTYSLFKNNDLFSNNKKRQLYLSGVGFKNAKLNYDTVLNQYSLTIHQDCKNIADPKYGRRLGNIQYKEDSWYATIEPLVFDSLLKASPEDQKAKWTSTRIRDKFLKVRVKYTGEDLVIITAIKNLCTLSRA